MEKQKTIKVTLVKSLIGTRRSHRSIIQGMGLRKLNHTVSLCDQPSIRGMISKTAYLLKVEE